MTDLTTAAFREVADRVWVARYAWFDVNVTLVGGERGLLVVDTHGSTGAAREVVDDVRRLGAGEVTGIVNTHWHFDHTFGNAAFREAYGDLRDPRPRDRPRRAAALGPRTSSSATPTTPTTRSATTCSATEVVLPDHTFSSAVALDLGDRAGRAGPPRPRPHRRRPRGPGARRRRAARRRPGRGVRSPVVRRRLLADGLAAEPRHRARPARPSASVVVPGHGAPVDRDFVEEQRNTIGIVAETIRDLADPRRPARPGAGRRRVALPGASGWRRPCAAATSTCPAASSGSRSSERCPAARRSSASRRWRRGRVGPP